MQMKLLLLLGIAVSCGLAIWLALEGNAAIALPLAVIVGTLARALVRVIKASVSARPMRRSPRTSRTDRSLKAIARRLERSS